MSKQRKIFIALYVPDFIPQNLRANYIGQGTFTFPTIQEAFNATAILRSRSISYELQVGDLDRLPWNGKILHTDLAVRMEQMLINAFGINPKVPFYPETIQ